MEDKYIYTQGKRLRCGYTTGTCAQAAARAAAIGFFTGEIPRTTEVTIPDGSRPEFPVEEAFRGTDETTGRPYAVCAVRKDAGDDIDVTDGMLVFAKVTAGEGTDDIRVFGGTGVGRVTRPGLDQPVGESAINSTPRRMIRGEVAAVMEELGEEIPLNVEIFLPDGEERAKKTMNERLGILGGLSILGTTGIVEPQSHRALIETIRAELSMRHAAGERKLLITPGNYGTKFIENFAELFREDDASNHSDANSAGRSPGASRNNGENCRAGGKDPAENAVKCSNFIGDTLDAAMEFGFAHVTLVGHIGKLVKLAGGMMNTHSMYGDCRMDLLAACGLKAGVPRKLSAQILDCITCDDALRILAGANCLEPVMKVMGDRILYHLNFRCKGNIGLRVVVFSNIYGVLVDLAEPGSEVSAQALP